MPYVLSFKTSGVYEIHLDTVSEAITTYDEIRELIGDGLKNCGATAKLYRPEKGTFVQLYPGIGVLEVTCELESIWEWAANDRLRIRPVLKKRYRAYR
jgi:hypothetical protein